MRPKTPYSSFVQQAGPSSPPATPTSAPTFTQSHDGLQVDHRPHPNYPLPIPPDKQFKALQYYKKYKLERRLQIAAALSNDNGFLLGVPGPASPGSTTSVASSRHHRALSTSTSAYDAVTDLSSIVSFDDYESGSSSRKPSELTSDSKKIKQRKSSKLNPEKRAKAALVRCLGSCWVCSSRRVPCPLEHHDIQSLEKLCQASEGYRPDSETPLGKDRSKMPPFVPEDSLLQDVGNNMDFEISLQRKESDTASGSGWTRYLSGAKVNVDEEELYDTSTNVSTSQRVDGEAEGGMQRLQWTCSCGHKAYDDFREHEPGATMSLANQLLEAGYISHAQISNSTDTPISALIMYINNAFTATKRRLSGLRSPSLPRFSKSGQTAGIPMACLPTNRCRWLHMCLKKRPYATKMEPLHVCKDEDQNDYTDASFFRALRKAYYNHRSWKEKLLFKLSKIEFVKFDLCPEDLVDHIIPNEFPPTVDEYEFQPPPPLKKCPPIGASHMMHLFTSCTAQPLNTSLYLQNIPKRKEQALSFQPGKLYDQTGYGLHFVEKLNSLLAVTVMFAVSLIFGIVFAICWTIRKQNIQGAFGVTSYVTSMITLAVMIWQMWSV